MEENMYGDSKFQWNVAVGCLFNCPYCEKSYKAQMKRQMPIIDKNGKKRGCQKCYDYEPHFHPERLDDKILKRLPRTYGDEFIWCCSSSDISFMKEEWINKIIEKIKEMPERTFFFQSKDPECFKKYSFPSNVILGTTIETDYDCSVISKAPAPYQRAISFRNINHPRKRVTIEPIMHIQDLNKFSDWIKAINPEIVYVGYDSKPNREPKLPEPTLFRTRKLIEKLEEFTKVKPKLLRERWDVL